jgi:hypothetical protein
LGLFIEKSELKKKWKRLMMLCLKHDEGGFVVMNLGLNSEGFMIS